MIDNLPNKNQGIEPTLIPEGISANPEVTTEQHYIRPQDVVEYFTTSHGSVYSYDKEGHTTRFKTAKGQEQPKQDLTVFIEVGPRDIGTVATAYLLRGSTERTRIEVAEMQPDGRPRVVTDATEVTLPDNLLLVTLKGSEIVRSRPVSLFPQLGLYAFDSRRFEEGGVTRTERHLGHKVTEIKPKVAS